MQASMRADCCFIVYSEVPSPKQFKGLITAGELSAITAEHAGIQMYLQLTVPLLHPTLLAHITAGL